MNITGKNVLIIGPPASGKTTLGLKLQEQSHFHTLYHSDDYMAHGYEQSLYVLMEDLKRTAHIKSIVEGVQGYRLLRKGVQLGVYIPDLVIELEVSTEQQAAIYAKERDERKIKYLRGFNASHQKILQDYFDLIGDRKPEWIKMKTY